MIFYETLHGAFDDSSQFYLQGAGGLFENLFVVVGDRAGKVYFQIFVIILHDVAGEEILESVQYDAVDTRFLDVLDEERRYRGEEPVWERVSVYPVENFLRGKVEAVEEFLFQLGSQLVFETVAHQQFAQYGAAPFVAQDIAQR